MRRPIRVVLTCLAAAATLLADSAGSLACTRLVYLGNNDDVITARSMDWKLDVATNLYILPRGIARTGESGPNSIKWTAKYGSVVATGYDVSTTDGMNEKGLAAELLWLVESQYPLRQELETGAHHRRMGAVRAGQFCDRRGSRGCARERAIHDRD